MTIEELRDYVTTLETDGEIPYYVYSNLIDMIDTLNVIPILEDTTNGDMIQAMFKGCPRIGFNERYGYVLYQRNDGELMKFTLEWWNAPYNGE